MSRYPENSTTGDWIMNTIRRNPEGLLLLAASAALLMRSGATTVSNTSSGPYGAREWDGAGSGRQSGVREGLSRAAEGASDFASSVKDRVTETAGSYAASASDYANETGRKVSEQSARLTRQAQSTLQTGMDRMLRDQPLAVAVLGAATGAAVAAMFPASEVENRALGGARDALADAASKAGENLMGAAGAAGERLKSAVSERGLDPEGLKEMARDVADTFSSAVTGKDGDAPGSMAKSNQTGTQHGRSTAPSLVPDNNKSGPYRGPR